MYRGNSLDISVDGGQPQFPKVTRSRFSTAHHASKKKNEMLYRAEAVLKDPAHEESFLSNDKEEEFNRCSESLSHLELARERCPSRQDSRLLFSWRHP